MVSILPSSDIFQVFFGFFTSIGNRIRQTGPTVSFSSLSTILKAGRSCLFIPTFLVLLVVQVSAIELGRTQLPDPSSDGRSSS
mmetsp:Transcript_36723/g.88772  ORF Transcript_36723/g.88772 Transcript_36723/m.88772 type:complete len:83 (+) Transcript_36723:693-941(+)